MGCNFLLFEHPQNRIEHPKRTERIKFRSWNSKAIGVLHVLLHWSVLLSRILFCKFKRENHCTTHWPNSALSINFLSNIVPNIRKLPLKIILFEDYTVVTLLGVIFPKLKNKNKFVIFILFYELKLKIYCRVNRLNMVASRMQLKTVAQLNLAPTSVY